MKTYRITVNGNVYDVTVEETTGNMPVSPQVIETPKQPVKKETPVKTSQNAGAHKVTSPMPGKILSVKASVGMQVKKDDVLLVLEAMKMENEIVSSFDGTVASVEVSVGNEVEAGAVLVTLN